MKRDSVTMGNPSNYMVEPWHFGADFNMDAETAEMGDVNLQAQAKSDKQLKLQQLQLVVSIIAMLIIAYSVFYKSKESK